MMRKLWFLAALAVSAILPTAASAAVSYSYVSEFGTYNLGAPGTVNVNIYLQETLTGGSTSLIAPQGMYGIGVGVDRKSGDLGSEIKSGTVATIGFTGGQAAYVNPTNPSHTQFGAVSNGDFGAPSGVVPVSGKILIGTVGIQANFGTTQFNLTMYPPIGVPGSTVSTDVGGAGAYDYNFTNNVQPNGGPSAVYTGTNDNPTFFTVTVVPEPSSMLLCGLAACGMGVGAWRRRRAKLAAAAAETQATPTL